MKLKFKTGILIVPVIMIAGLPVLLIFLLNTIVQHPDRISEKIHSVVIGIILFLVVVLIILFREIKFRWNAIEIIDHELVVRSFLGLGPTRRIKFQEVTGFNSVKEPSKRKLLGHVIYIYENNKRTIEISDVFCENFQDVQDELRKRLKELGGEDFKMLKGFVNAFGFPIRLEKK